MDNENTSQKILIFKPELPDRNEYGAMEDIYYIVYISTATKPMSEAELDEFLVDIRKRNKKLGVTGMLLYNRGNFIQVIEGKEEKIKQLFNDISRDERHNTLVKILEGHTEERLFPDWSMGYRKISNRQSSRIRGFSNFMNDELSMEQLIGSAGEIMEILNSFKRHT